MLRVNNLQVSGRKEELIQRLYQASRAELVEEWHRPIQGKYPQTWAPFRIRMDLDMLRMQFKRGRIKAAEHQKQYEQLSDALKNAIDEYHSLSGGNNGELKDSVREAEGDDIENKPVHSVLEDGYSGVEDQRRFVEIALKTPDFAILEGPPGSGKTAVITEIILRAIEKGQRVLLCASTHVAVDNVVRRLKDDSTPFKDEVQLVRVGDEAKLDRFAAKYSLKQRLDTEMKALKQDLGRIKEPTDYQKILHDSLSKGNSHDIMQRIILDSAQVVCGTTVGILQLPEIKKHDSFDRPVEPRFDMLILDEASKTTFPEFIVPAMHAKKWIIVGDCRQLSPFLNHDEIETNLSAAFERSLDEKFKDDKSTWRSRCFQIREGINNANFASVIIQVEDDDDRSNSIAQAIHAAGVKKKELIFDLRNFDSEDITNCLELMAAAVVVGTETEITNSERFLPYSCIHLKSKELDILRARSAFSVTGLRTSYGKINGCFQRELRLESSWEDSILWRSKKEYESRIFSQEFERGREHTLPIDTKPLLPCEAISKEDGVEEITNVLMVAFPSIIESLQFGFGRGRRLKKLKSRGNEPATNAITHGLPEPAKKQRHVALRYQHRMHPEISKFPRDHIYQGELLKDSDQIEERRSDFPRGRRNIWIDVPDGLEKISKSPRNPREADAVIHKIEELDRKLHDYLPPRGDSWSVAVLTFYRGQESELLSRLQKRCKQKRSPFRIGCLNIELGTVDRFQGNEADVVILSYVRTGAPGFLDSSNRLNVAITRARYQMIHVGKKKFFKNNRRVQDKAPLLHQIVNSLPNDAFSVFWGSGKKRRT